MSGKGIHAFDSTVQEANVWLMAVMDRLETEDAHHAQLALRAVLHTLRDRIRPESAVHLGAQLPTLIRGLYYDGWHMAGTPTKERRMEQFLAHVRWAVPRTKHFDPEDAARAVFGVLWEKVDPGEVAKLIRMFPVELRKLWPAVAQADAEER